jgi:hypothetical protein
MYIEFPSFNSNPNPFQSQKFLFPSAPRYHSPSSAIFESYVTSIASSRNILVPHTLRVGSMKDILFR